MSGLPRFQGLSGTQVSGLASAARQRVRHPPPDPRARGGNEPAACGASTELRAIADAAPGEAGTGRQLAALLR